MKKYEYIFEEAGNGFPQDGEEVLLEDELGWHKLMTIVESSPIHTIQWQANFLYLMAVESERDYDSLSESEQDEVWESHYRIQPLTDDSLMTDD